MESSAVYQWDTDERKTWGSRFAHSRTLSKASSMLKNCSVLSSKGWRGETHGRSSAGNHAEEKTALGCSAYSWQQMPTSAKPATAVTAANTALFKYDTDITVYSSPFRPWIQQLCEHYSHAQIPSCREELTLVSGLCFLGLTSSKIPLSKTSLQLLGLQMWV